MPRTWLFYQAVDLREGGKQGIVAVVAEVDEHTWSIQYTFDMKGV
jgi:hypothetical protein